MEHAASNTDKFFPRTPDDEFAEKRSDLYWSLTDVEWPRKPEQPQSIVVMAQQLGKFALWYPGRNDGISIYPTMKHRSKVGFVQHPLYPSFVER